MNNSSAPARGYILTEWNDENAYRATAQAYMKRKGFLIIRNKDGKTYHLDEIEKSMIGGGQSA